MLTMLTACPPSSLLTEDQKVRRLVGNRTVKDEIRRRDRSGDMTATVGRQTADSMGGCLPSYRVGW